MRLWTFRFLILLIFPLFRILTLWNHLDWLTLLFCNCFPFILHSAKMIVIEQVHIQTTRSWILTALTFFWFSFNLLSALWQAVFLLKYLKFLKNREVFALSRVWLISLFLRFEQIWMFLNSLLLVHFLIRLVKTVHNTFFYNFLYFSDATTSLFPY